MGVFEDTIKALGLTPRPQQTKLVEAARGALSAGGVAMIQAGTGTGKSFALLTTALEAARESGQSSVVVCPNNALVNQYVDKDVPSVRGVAGGRFVHIKGRNRYLCSSSVALFHEKNADQIYRSLVKDGELEWANIEGLDERYGCPGSETCDPMGSCTCGAYKINQANKAKRKERLESGLDFDDDLFEDLESKVPCVCVPTCGAIRARQLAVGADVIVTNGHVVIWDYLIGVYTDGNAGLLPPYGALFVDECHELEGIGRGCVTEEITSNSRLCKAITGLADWIEDQTEWMLEADKREMPLERNAVVLRMAGEATEMIDELESVPEPSKSTRAQIKRLRRFIDFVSESDDFVSIIEVQETKTVLRRICVDMGQTFNRILTAQPTVLTSGTIPSSDRRRLGLPKTVKIADVGSPFDYSRSQLVISKYDPTSKTDAVYRVQSVIRAINQTKGGTLVLFTSWADLETVMPKVAMGLDRGIDVYVQSREDPATLKQDVIDFREDGNAVLAGVRSLFTGLDIPGPALRQVVIWRLPYAVPTIEVQAIGQLFGRNVYTDQMLQTLTQAIGRLVRTTDDCGRILIMDNRAAKLDFGSNGMTHHLNEFSG